jgi:hypothetical protein
MVPSTVPVGHQFGSVLVEHVLTTTSLYRRIGDVPVIHRTKSGCPIGTVCTPEHVVHELPEHLWPYLIPDYSIIICQYPGTWYLPVLSLSGEVRIGYSIPVLVTVG